MAFFTMKSQVIVNQSKYILFLKKYIKFRAPKTHVEKSGIKLPQRSIYALIQRLTLNLTGKGRDPLSQKWEKEISVLGFASLIANLRGGECERINANARRSYDLRAFGCRVSDDDLLSRARSPLSLAWSC
ncbi:MAG: hypothetical protein LBE22_05330, partial [Azoarcus sp.]|nr:hypothetical protein [Azoarcus sp.]